MPIATAIIATIRNYEKPSILFWIASMVGSLAVIIFSWTTGSKGFHTIDLALMVAVIFAAVGHVEGAERDKNTKTQNVELILLHTGVA